MDIKSFLSSGTTHVHTSDPRGNFANSAQTVVLLLAMAAATGSANASESVKDHLEMAASTGSTTLSGPAVAPALRQAGSVAEMPFANDPRSLLYQGLVAPELSSNIRLVSTRFSSLLPFLSTMPKGLLEEIAMTPDDAARISSSYSGLDASATSFTYRGSFYENQSVCMVNAIEEVEENTIQINGVPSFALGENSPTGAAFAELATLEPQEAKTIVTLHELAHCVISNESRRVLLAEDGLDINKAINTSFYETMSDLAVVLYYASQEQSFENAQIALAGMRSSIGYTSHATADNLARIIKDLNPADYRDMPMHKIFQEVTRISEDQMENHSNEFVASFMQETWEKMYLRARLDNNQEELKGLDSDFLATMRDVAEIRFPVNPYSRAHDMIDIVLNNGIRNPDRTRALGLINFDHMSDLAKKLGVVLTPDQIIKTRFLDSEFNPPGTRSALGIEVPANLRVVDYTQQLEMQASQALDVKKSYAPRFN